MSDCGKFRPTMKDHEEERKIMSDNITRPVSHPISHGPADCPNMPEKFVFIFAGVNTRTWILKTTWQVADKTNQVSDTMTICPWCGKDLYALVPQTNTGTITLANKRIHHETGVITQSVAVKLDRATPSPRYGDEVELTWRERGKEKTGGQFAENANES